MRKTEYGYTEKDVMGNTVSIDNLVCEWQYAGSEKKIRSDIFEAFEQFVDGFDPLRHAAMDKPCAGKYSWFKNGVWGDGVFLRWDKFRQLSKNVETRNIVQLEVNPNKHWNTPIMQWLREYIKANFTGGNLRKYDFAVDVPVRMQHVKVESRKKTSVVHGTQYYGERNKHGHLRVYDKKSELLGRGSNVDDDELTRFEWTFVDGKPIVFDNIGLRFFDSFHTGYGNLSQNGKMIADLCGMLIEKGVEWSDIAPVLNRTTRKNTETAISGAYVRLCLSEDLAYSLLGKYCAELNVTYRDGESKYIVHGFNNQAMKLMAPMAVARPGG